MFNTRSYLLTEFIDGESLYRVLRYRDLSPRQMRSLARQVAAIWQQLANLGASHNDLKPENLMVDRRERVWLIDLEMVHWHRRRRELEARHLLDATRFFHARSWRRQPAARELFLEALLAVPLGRRLLDIAPGGHVLRHHRLSRHELESGLSVVVRCGDRFGGSLPRRSLDSVLDFADEVLLAYPAEESGRRLYRLSGDCQSLECLAPGTSPAQPWVLRLVEDDCLPADTGKEIQERIADRAAADYYRADIEQIDPLHPLASRTRRRTPEIRLLHRERCRYNAVDDRFEHESLRGGVLRFSLTSTGSGSSELAQPKPRPGLRSAA